jgi:beta-xylosidase
VYPSHDRETSIQFNDNGDQYDMTDYHVLSLSSPSGPTTDHGIALKQEDVPWVSKQLWAPDCAYNASAQKYHLFFPARDKSGIFRIGVAISSQPEGPFTPEPTPIPGSYSIDPAIFVDDDKDASAYLYFGGLWGGQLQCWSSGTFDSSLSGPQEPTSGDALFPRFAKMNPDMLTFTEKGAQELTLLDESGKPIVASDHEKRFFEAPWLHKHAGKYYFSYSTGDTHLIAYAIGTSPEGPYTYKGTLLPPVVGWTTHHSIVAFEGRHWLFYHDCTLSGGVDHLRCVKVREIEYDEEGAMRLVG